MLKTLWFVEEEEEEEDKTRWARSHCLQLQKFLLRGNRGLFLGLKGTV